MNDQAHVEAMARALELVPSMIAYWDRDLRCRFANRAYEKWFGVDPKGLVGKGIDELLGPELFAKNEPFMRAALRGEVQQFERLVPGADGVQRHSLAYYVPDVADGEVRGFVAYVTEVTKLKTTEGRLNEVIRELKDEVERRRGVEETLAEVEQNLAVALDSIEAGFLSTDREGRVLRMNQVAEHITGFSADEARGRSIFEVFVREGRPAEMLEANPVDLVVAHESPKGPRRAIVAVSRDGRRTLVEAQSSVTRHADGAPLGIALLVRDMTRLDSAERAARRLAALVAASSDAIIAKDLDSTITDWNEGARALFGWTAEEAVGRSIRLIFPDDLWAQEPGIMAAIRRDEAVPPTDSQRVTKDGRRIDVSVGASPIRDALGNVVGASTIVRDITDRKRLEADLVRSNLELEQFAYVASHDLQEPLRMVVNYAELLEARYRDQLDDRAKKYIHFAVDGARRMQQLVSDLLAYSRVGSQGKPLVRVALGPLVQSVVKSLGVAVRESGAVVETGPLPDVMGDEVQLRQLMQNLLTNAIKFRSAEPPRIVVSASERDGKVVVTVRDNGIGFDMKHAGRIFQMFQRLHPAGAFPGSGIGLAIAKRIVDRHGGLLTVDATPGGGATFSFTLNPAPAA